MIFLKFIDRRVPRPFKGCCNILARPSLTQLSVRPSVSHLSAENQTKCNAAHWFGPRQQPWAKFRPNSFCAELDLVEDRKPRPVCGLRQQLVKLINSGVCERYEWVTNVLKKWDTDGWSCGASGVGVCQLFALSGCTVAPCLGAHTSM